jgi:murein DD-endopeptidase MepM/ murein hydrolase activator NlpD
VALACALVGAGEGHTAAIASVAEQRQEVEQRRERVSDEIQQHRNELHSTESRLQDHLDELDDIEQRLEVTVADLQRLDRRVAQLDEELAQLETELATAEKELATAQQRLAATTSKLVATQEKLAQTRRQLARQRETFAERSRASYVHGGSAAMVTQLLDVGDVSEFARSMRYVESVLAEDRQRVQRISGLAREVEATKQDLAQLQQRRIAQRTHAKSQRDEVARLVEEQRQLRAEVAAQRKERRQVMLALQADRDSHQQLVASLRQASQQIEAELAALAQREERLTAREQQLAQRQAERERRTSQDSGGSQGSGGSQDSGGSQGSGGGSAAPASDGRFQQPSQGRITSSFGYRTHPIHGTRRLHAGVDLAAGYGAPNYAAADGVVVSAGWRGGYGRTVVISHGGGLSTLYAHQSRLAVSSGQQVTRGQVVGYEGASGAVTGPHLHFEVRVNGRPRNPVSYLR